jgi:hypothetical protein
LFGREDGDAEGHEVGGEKSDVRGWGVPGTSS